MLDPTSGERLQTHGEEVANSVSHGVGFVAALAAVPFLIANAARRGTPGDIVGASVFSLTILLLYLTSTLYHALPRGPAKHQLRLIEHGAIFILIAGTYTPIALGVLRGVWGWSLFGVIWGLAACGVILAVTGGVVRYPKLSAVLYIAMGWVVVFAARPMWLKMSHEGVAWIVVGGLTYTLGVVFYVLDRRMRYSHFIWHLFVMTGTTLHYFAIYWYAV